MTIQKMLEKRSRQLNEPAALTNLRLEGAIHYEVAAPLKIERLDYEKWLNINDSEEFLKTLAPEPKLKDALDVAHKMTLMAEGVYIAPFSQVLKERPTLLTKYFAHCTQQYLNENKQLAIHQAFFSDSLVLYFPKKFKSKQPIHLSEKIAGWAVHNVLIILEEQAEVELVHTLSANDSQAGQAHILVEVFGHENSHFTYLSVNMLDDVHPAYILRSGFTMRNATIMWKQVELGESHEVSDLRVHMLGEGSESTLEAIAISDGQQVVGVNSQIVNMAPHTMADIHQKGVALDHSTLTFTAIGHIINQAKNANSEQESRILMLSKDARGDTNPILLIDEYEVMAGHAASIGQIPPQDLYYLTSRGLRPQVALKLYALGFLKSTITGDFYEGIVDLEKMLEEKMMRYAIEHK
ncbi:SufD family Fe-S cluster assembly protein [Allofustis seminis]|uniref:SufD family Fe-S cluster assembly protein n=1 Tax=Allofustis seminis TaxID=166939 RepID=UPI0003A10B63|nr:SufD family Fe-S cluster assembly protein [Allofustis seminis]